MVGEGKFSDGLSPAISGADIGIKPGESSSEGLSVTIGEESIDGVWLRRGLGENSSGVIDGELARTVGDVDEADDPKREGDMV